ncbi:MAG: hypothetical protein M1832_004906 [Thelocarpon impressellum]|nr:MAG: hypothetical protein M1832_004906 [Thelocarpon impressellum]
MSIPTIEQRLPSPPSSTGGDALPASHPRSVEDHANAHYPDPACDGYGSLGPYDIRESACAGLGLQLVRAPVESGVCRWPLTDLQLDGQRAMNYFPQQRDGGYAMLPAGQQSRFYYSVHPESPPVSTASDYSPGPRHTRTGRATAASASPVVPKAAPPKKSRASKSPRIKKAARRSKRDKQKAFTLTAPLSELTKDYRHIPIRDIESWVNRSVETRQHEVELRKGHVPRPMNSFMLYRSAFADRTKLWCLQNNHQVVSSVSGQSWPLETADVRDRYNLYAKLERENHQHAHPGYKFSPSKAGAAARKRKTDVSDTDESGPSDADDFDEDWTGSRPRRTKAGKPGQRPGPPGPGRPDASPAPDEGGDGLNRSSYQATNPGKPLPMAMADQDLGGYYYQTTVHPSVSAANVEDVRVQMTERPTGQQSAYLGLTGLPGASHHELFQQHSQGGSPAPLDDRMVDPFLLTYGRAQHGPETNDRLHEGISTYHDGSNALDPHQQQLQLQQHQLHYGMLDQGQAQAEMPRYLGDAPGSAADSRYLPPGWDHTIDGLLMPSSDWQTGNDPGSEFDKWYNGQV